MWSRKQNPPKKDKKGKVFHISFLLACLLLPFSKMKEIGATKLEVSLRCVAVLPISDAPQFRRAPWLYLALMAAEFWPLGPHDDSTRSCCQVCRKLSVLCGPELLDSTKTHP